MSVTVTENAQVKGSQQRILTEDSNLVSSLDITDDMKHSNEKLSTSKPNKDAQSSQPPGQSVLTV